MSVFWCRWVAATWWVLTSWLVRFMRWMMGRLMAAHTGLALSRSFAALRKGEPEDIKNALEAAAAAGRKDLTLKGVTLPNGTGLDHIEIHNETDARLFSQALGGYRSIFHRSVSR